MAYANPEAKKAWMKAHAEQRNAYKREHYDPEKERDRRIRRRDQLNRASKAWRDRNPGYRSTEARKARYGLSKQQFEELMTAANHKCSVCGKKFGKDHQTKPRVDHCHDTGVIRGLLCNKCNLAEGFMGTVENARKLYEYMLRNELFYERKDTGLS